MDLRCPGCSRRLRLRAPAPVLPESLSCPVCGAGLREAPVVLSRAYRILPGGRPPAGLLSRQVSGDTVSSTTGQIGLPSQPPPLATVKPPSRSIPVESERPSIRPVPLSSEPSPPRSIPSPGPPAAPSPPSAASGRERPTGSPLPEGRIPVRTPSPPRSPAFPSAEGTTSMPRADAAAASSGFTMDVPIGGRAPTTPTDPRGAPPVVLREDRLPVPEVKPSRTFPVPDAAAAIPAPLPSTTSRAPGHSESAASDTASPPIEPIRAVQPPAFATGSRRARWLRGTLAGGVVGLLFGAVFLLVLVALDWPGGSPLEALATLDAFSWGLIASLAGLGMVAGLLISMLSRSRGPS